MQDNEIANWLLGAGFLDMAQRMADESIVPQRIPRDVEGLIECPLLPVRDTVLVPAHGHAAARRP